MLRAGGNAVSRVATAIPAMRAAVTLVPRRLVSRSLVTVPIAARPLATPASLVSPARRFYAKSYPKHMRLPMPALSPTMTAGNIATWGKKEGDEINPGDVLVQIETDKATMDFESTDEGFLAKILVPNGTKDVQVNEPLAIIVENREDIAAFSEYSLGDEPAAAAPAASTQVSVAKPEASPVETRASQPAPARSAPAAGDRIIASPLAKMIAAERNVSLSGVTGTGPGGRIVKQDVVSYQPQAAAAPAAATAPLSAPATAATGDFIEVPTSRVRQIIAARLTESKQTIPHYYLTADLRMDKLMELRAALNNTLSEKEGKISVNDFVIKASSLALLRVPEVNSSWGKDSIRQYTHADIAVAVATPSGLITPIVQRADTRGLLSISRSVRDMSARAKENKLAPHEYQGGSFSISNLGMFGMKQFAAIINPPHAAILAVGAIEPRVVPDEDGVTPVVRNMMSVTLSCDHRVVDGAVGAQWVRQFKSFIEEPNTMLL